MCELLNYNFILQSIRICEAKDLLKLPFFYFFLNSIFS